MRAMFKQFLSMKLITALFLGFPVPEEPSIVKDFDDVGSDFIIYTEEIGLEHQETRTFYPL